MDTNLKPGVELDKDLDIKEKGIDYGKFGKLEKAVTLGIKIAFIVFGVLLVLGYAMKNEVIKDMDYFFSESIIFFSTLGLMYSGVLWILKLLITMFLAMIESIVNKNIVVAMLFILMLFIFGYGFITLGKEAAKRTSNTFKDWGLKQEVECTLTDYEVKQESKTVRGNTMSWWLLYGKDKNNRKYQVEVSRKIARDVEKKVEEDNKTPITLKCKKNTGILIDYKYAE